MAHRFLVLLAVRACALRRELSAGCLASQGVIQTAESSSLIVIRGDNSVTLLDTSLGTGAALLDESSYAQYDTAVDWEPLQIYAQITVPSDYDHSLAYPLLVTHHGWSGNENSMKIYHAHALAHGYVVVSGRGWNDTTVAGESEATLDSYNSWNGAGTSSAVGPWGATCCGASECSGSAADDYCPAFYNNSCTGCAAEEAAHGTTTTGVAGDSAAWQNNCIWTNCLDSVSQTERILAAVEGLLCINTSMVLSTGYSNGGIFQFELAQDERTAHRVPTFTVTAGAPHAGFNVGPSVAGATLVGFYGVADTTIPPLHTPPDELQGASSDTTSSLDTEFYGWYYSTARNNSELWARANGCDGGTTHFQYLADDIAWTPDDELLADEDMNVDVVSWLNCTEWTGCSPRGNFGAAPRVIECLHDKGHIIPSWSPDIFFSLFMKEYVDQMRTNKADSWMVSTLVLGALLLVLCVVSMFCWMSPQQNLFHRAHGWRQQNESGIEATPVPAPKR